jgi:hypothetical protein
MSQVFVAPGVATAALAQGLPIHGRRLVTDGEQSMKGNGLATVVVAIAILSASPAAAAQGRGRGHDKHDESPQGDRDEAITIDRASHVRVIREYERAGSLPPGLAKREELPPGLRKQLHEKGELPPGLQKHLVPVPSDLDARLPRIPSYDRRYFAGNDLIVVNIRTNHIDAILTAVWK